MKIIFFAFILLTILCSCSNDDSSEKAFRTAQKTSQAVPIDSTEILFKARGLRDHLFADVINIDSIQWYVDNGTDLNLHLPHQYNYTNGFGREGGLLHTITQSTHTVHLEMTALQTLLFNLNKNYEKALMVLLLAGADPNPELIGDEDRSPLDYAMIENLDYWVFDSLISYGADVRTLNLGYARDDLKRIKHFLKLGANAKTINLNDFIESGPFTSNKDWKINFDNVMRYDVNPQTVWPHQVVHHNLSVNEYALDKLLAKGLDFNKSITSGSDSFWLDIAVSQTHNNHLTIYLLKHGARKCKDHLYAFAEKNGFNQEVLDLIEKKIGK